MPEKFQAVPLFNFYLSVLSFFRCFCCFLCNFFRFLFVKQSLNAQAYTLFFRVNIKYKCFDFIANAYCLVNFLNKAV